VPATWQPRSELESLHITSLACDKENQWEHCKWSALLDFCGSCLRLMTSWNTAVYRYHGIFETVYYLRPILNTALPYSSHAVAYIFSAVWLFTVYVWRHTSDGLDLIILLLVCDVCLVCVFLHKVVLFCQRTSWLTVSNTIKYLYDKGDYVSMTAKLSSVDWTVHFDYHFARLWFDMIILIESVVAA